MESISIKKLPISKWKEFKYLRLEALKSEPTAFGSSYEEEKERKASAWKSKIKDVIFALYNDKPVGMIKYIFENELKMRHVAGIYGFYVSNGYRGQGIGNNLIESALSAIRKNKKIIKVTLSVFSNQKAAIRLYKKKGFKSVGKLEKASKVNGKFYDEIIMERFI